MRHLSDALARGAAPALWNLDLRHNQIGDEGLRHLSDALARGAAPAIKEFGWTGLHIAGNPASGAAQQAVQDALENRKAASGPLVAAHFHGQGRLAALVLGPAGDATTATAVAAATTRVAAAAAAATAAAAVAATAAAATGSSSIGGDERLLRLARLYTRTR